MSKKKRKTNKRQKEQKGGVLRNIDENIITQYLALQDDIADYQYQIYLADKKAKKKQKKNDQKDSYYVYQTKGYKTRMKVIGEMEERNFLQTIIRTFTDCIPIFKLLGRVIALLLTAILSVDAVRRNINPKTMNDIDHLFNMTMSL